MADGENSAVVRVILRHAGPDMTMFIRMLKSSRAGGPRTGPATHTTNPVKTEDGEVACYDGVAALVGRLTQR